MIKIAITGVHGSGKSKKVINLMEHYTFLGNKVYIVEEVARLYSHPLGTVKAQEWVWKEQMIREKAAMSNNVNVIICDRTVMDNLMYYRAIIEEPGNIHNWRINFFGWLDLYREAVNWMPTYNQIIRLPLNLEWLQEDDPIRSKNVAYARRIDRLFDKFVGPFVTNDEQNLYIQ